MKKRQHPSVSLASTDKGQWGTGTGQTKTPLFGQKRAPVPDFSHDALLSVRPHRLQIVLLHLQCDEHKEGTLFGLVHRVRL